MIIVLGLWPRSGTSLLMSMLTAGGLDPIRDDDPTDLTGAHPVGAFQHSGVLLDDTATVLPSMAAARSCVKLFPRHIADLAQRDAGWAMVKVIIAVRDADEAAASWDSAFPDRSRQDRPGQEAEARHVLAVLTELGVPSIEVAFHDLIDHPAREAARIGEFVGDLDVDAMAVIPDAEHRHFGGAATT